MYIGKETIYGKVTTIKALREITRKNPIVKMIFTDAIKIASKFLHNFCC